jgi:hypothetical protein
MLYRHQLRSINQADAGIGGERLSVRSQIEGVARPF